MSALFPGQRCVSARLGCRRPQGCAPPPQEGAGPSFAPSASLLSSWQEAELPSSVPPCQLLEPLGVTAFPLNFFGVCVFVLFFLNVLKVLVLFLPITMFCSPDELHHDVQRALLKLYAFCDLVSLESTRLNFMHGTCLIDIIFFSFFSSVNC